MLHHVIGNESVKCRHFSCDIIPCRPAHSVVQIHHAHNHATMTCDALAKRDVSAKTKRRLTELFAEGYGPTAAINILKFDLHQECTDNQYGELSADRAIIPDVYYAVR